MPSGGDGFIALGWLQDHATLLCLDHLGEVRWHLNTNIIGNVPSLSAPIVLDDVVVVAAMASNNQDGAELRLMGFRTDNGKPVFSTIVARIPTPRQFGLAGYEAVSIAPSVAVQGGYLLVLSNNGVLARVGIDYHVEVEGFFYSVPHTLIREQVDTRATTRTIEVFHRGQRVAAHARRYGGPRHGTEPAHMPSAHRRYAEWSPDRFARAAREFGPHTEALILAVLARRRHPEQGFRTCIGILRLFRGLAAERAEAVSLRAVEIGVLSYDSVASILRHRLDRSACSQPAESTPLLHKNIRGSGYFH